MAKQGARSLQLARIRGMGMGTGSEKHAKSVAAACAEDDKRESRELSGKWSCAGRDSVSQGIRSQRDMHVKLRPAKLCPRSGLAPWLPIL